MLWDFLPELDLPVRRNEFYAPEFLASPEQEKRPIIGGLDYTSLHIQWQFCAVLLVAKGPATRVSLDVVARLI